MNEPSISIIVPVYNVGSPLARCLDSLCAQTVEGLEIIAINDASPDENDRRTLDKYAAEHDNVIAITLEDNIPVGAVRDAGMHAARGRYIGFVDADDYLDPCMYETMLKRITDDASDLAVCRRIEFDSDGMMKPIGFRDSIAGYSFLDATTREGTEQLMLGLTTFVWDKLFSQAVIKENDLHIPSTRYAEDASFVIKYLSCCKSASLVNQPLYFYNCDSASGVTNSFSQSWMDIVPSLEDAASFLQERGCFDEYEHAFWMTSAAIFARRVRCLHRCYGDQHRQIEFVDSYRRFFAQTFKNPARRLREDFPDVARFYDPLRARLYIWRPPFLKFDPQETAKLRPAYAYGKLTAPGIRYMRARKRYPVKKGTVLFFADNGAAADSPFYLMREMAADGGMSLYLASNDIERDRAVLESQSLRPEIVEWGSTKFAKVLASSEYLVTNTILPGYFIKQRGQKVLDTWHGTPFKTLGFDMSTPWEEIGSSQTVS